VQLSMHTKISNLLKQIDTILVTPEFIEHRNNEAAKGTYDPWAEYKNCDFLLLEHYLKENGLVYKQNSWRHDFIIIVESIKYIIDAKNITSNYFNIKTEKQKAQYKESIRLGELTHFLMYSSFPDMYKTKYKVGDKIKIQFRDFLPATYVMNNLKESKDEGWYFDLRDKKMCTNGQKHDIINLEEVNKLFEGV